MNNIFIVTRFNLPITFNNYNKEVNKMGDPPLGDQWLNDRKGFFNNILAPSITSQSYSDFRWFVLFHSETSDSYINSLKGGFIPIKANSYSECLDEIKDYYSQDPTALKEKRVYISVRVDSDDSISSDYVGLINESVSKNYFKYINNSSVAICARDGHYVDIKTGKKRKRAYPDNPFCALAEYKKINEISSIYTTEHTKLSKEFFSISISSGHVNKFYWSISIHENNVGNSWLDGTIVNKATIKAKSIRSKSLLSTGYFKKIQDALKKIKKLK